MSRMSASRLNSVRYPLPCQCDNRRDQGPGFRSCGGRKPRRTSVRRVLPGGGDDRLELRVPVQGAAIGVRGEFVRVLEAERDAFTQRGECLGTLAEERLGAAHLDGDLE